MDLQELDARYQDAYNAIGRWLGLYQELYLYVIPNRDGFNIKWEYIDGGKPTTRSVWDNTAMLAAYERANDLHALLMPKDRIWGKSVLDPHLYEEAQIEQLQPVVDEINDRVMFYLNSSNLARIVSSSNLDLVGGTAALWVESIDDQTPLLFRAIPSVALYIEQSTDDLVNTCWYQTNLYARKIIETFPKYKGRSLQMLKDNLDEVHQVIYGQIKIGEKGKEKYYIYAVLESDPDNLLWEVERSYPQIIVYRDRVRPGEADGRGIGLDLLPTIIDLNKLVRDDRKNKAFKADPPMFYDNNKMFNPWSVRQWSGAMIARQPGQRNPVEALQMPVYPEVNESIMMLQDVIKKGFQVDPLGEINNPVKTATEISIRENRAQRSSSTDISRLINELPKQVFEVSAKILAERRLLTRDRDIGSINIHNFRFDFQSPLYDIQKKENVEKLAQNLQLKQQFFGEGAAMGTLNIGEANDYLTENFNLPSKLFKSGAEIEKLMQQVGDQANQEQAAQMQQGAPTPTTTGAEVGLPQGTPEQF